MNINNGSDNFLTILNGARRWFDFGWKLLLKQCVDCYGKMEVNG